jgi:hypothetical protein
VRWLGVTIGLLAASLSLVAWVYLRDRDTSGWRRSERPIALADAAVALAAFGGPGCHRDCGVELLEHQQSGHWFARITTRGQTQCLEINLATFAFNSRHGLTGVRPSRCAPANFR